MVKCLLAMGHSVHAGWGFNITRKHCTTDPGKLNYTALAQTPFFVASSFSENNFPKKKKDLVKTVFDASRDFIIYIMYFSFFVEATVENELFTVPYCFS